MASGRVWLFAAPTVWPQHSWSKHKQSGGFELVPNRRRTGAVPRGKELIGGWGGGGRGRGGGVHGRGDVFGDRRSVYTVMHQEATSLSNSRTEPFPQLVLMAIYNMRCDSDIGIFSSNAVYSIKYFTLYFTDKCVVKHFSYCQYIKEDSRIFRLQNLSNLCIQCLPLVAHSD